MIGFYSCNIIRYQVIQASLEWAQEFHPASHSNVHSSELIDIRALASHRPLCAFNWSCVGSRRTAWEDCHGRWVSLVCSGVGDINLWRL